VTGFYPNAIRKNIKPGDNDPEITPALAILHVAVSDTESLFDFFRFRSGGIESHFYIRLTGRVEQYRNVLREADANLGANSYESDGKVLGAVSIETAGFGGGSWNLLQRRAIKKLLSWLHEEHGIPLKPVHTPFPSLAQGGVSWHTKFPQWSPVAKSCPGPKRITQFKQWLKPWMVEQSTPPCLHCPSHCPATSEGDA
jgi:hypothetical protein